MPRQELYVGELMLKMMSGRTGEISRVDYVPQKPPYEALKEDGQHMPVSTPEGQGVPGAFCEALFRKLTTDPACNLHRIMVARHGYVIAEAAVGPFDRDLWHVTYSMCKSVTGMAVGMLIEEGKLSLDDHLTKYFEVPRTGLGRILKKEIDKDDITIRHLLTMSSGVSFNESGAMAGNNWTTSFMESSMNFDPGTQFEYNSMNSYMLSAIVGKITGDTLFAYLKPRLFDPMGIERVFWEVSPEGVNKGGWGMFMRIEDMVKLGQLYLQGGKWDGRQLIPEDWVRASVAPQIETGVSTAGQYGYHLWLNGHREGSYTFNGMLGQNVYIYPDLDLVIATQAGNEDVFQEGGMSTFIKDAVRAAEFSDDPLPDDPASMTRLTALKRHLGGGVADSPVITAGGWKHKRIRMTDGSAESRYMEGFHLPRAVIDSNSRKGTYTMNRFRRYVTESLNGSLYDVDFKSTGLIPLLMQVVHNNFTDGIKKIGFHRNEQGSFFMDIYEGDRRYTLECGFGDRPVVHELDMHGEIYTVGVISRCFITEEHYLLFRSQVIFLEEAATRIIDIYFDRTLYPAERLSTMPAKAPLLLFIRLDETPGSNMLLATLHQVMNDSQSGVKGRLVSALESMGAINMLDTRIRAAVRPTLHARRI